MRKKKPDVFQFPPKLLEQINECSNGGFALFNFDDQGLPQIYSMIDNPICALALQSHVQNWGKAMETFNVETSVDHLFKQTRKK